MGEKPHEPSGDHKADYRSCQHDSAGHGKDDAVDLGDSLVFPRAVVVSDQGSHGLDEAICRQIEEGLQLVVDAKDQDVYAGVGGQDPVQGGDQHLSLIHI